MIRTVRCLHDDIACQMSLSLQQHAGAEAFSHLST